MTAARPPSFFSRFKVDGFILAILGAVAVASVLPVRGAGIAVADWAVTIALAALFFLYGARIEPRQALAGLAHWRLHLTILAITFVVFPLLGVALRPLLAPVIGDELALGVLYLTLVPSTVQSSIAFTSIARGNIPGAIVSASASNLLGVFLTPLLVVALMTTSGDVHIGAETVLTIMAQLLLPFLVGQLARPLVGGWVLRKASSLKYIDRGGIVLIVYVAFSDGVRDGIWSTVSVWQVFALLGVSVALVAAMLWFTGALARRLGFDRADAIAIQFCGTKKSLATGLPMAAVLFAGQSIGLLVLPLMLFHQVQLMMCAWLAARYARSPEPN